jgi:uncharacterized protein YeaO (DUF488 family)
VKKAEIAGRDYYDLWLPELSPSAELVKQAQSASTAADWQRFRRRYRAEMAGPAASRMLDLLALLSRQTDLAVGCYCEEESHCHRSVLRELLVERGAEVEK